MVTLWDSQSGVGNLLDVHTIMLAAIILLADL